MESSEGRLGLDADGSISGGQSKVKYRQRRDTAKDRQKPQVFRMRWRWLYRCLQFFHTAFKNFPPPYLFPLFFMQSQQFLSFPIFPIRINQSSKQQTSNVFPFILFYTPMGNSQAGPYTTIPRDFPIQKYLNQGLNQNQILQVKYAFDSYEPQDGRIDLSKLKPVGGQAQSKEKIEKYLGKKEKMNFDEFFAMSKEVLQEENKKYGQLNIDNNEMQASCLFCPYAIDKNK